MKKRILGLVFVLVLFLSFATVCHAAEIVDSGTCGDNLTWTLDDEGTLTISGEGEMYDWQSCGPWYGHSIYTVIIEKGVTSIGTSAFENCTLIKNVNIGNDVTKISSYAFCRCYGITDIYLPESIISIDYDSFYACTSLRNVELNNGLKNIGDSAFEACISLNSINIPNSVISIGSLVFEKCRTLTNINVSDDNSNYSVIDGILLDKSGTKIICYPIGKTETEYSIPNNIETIGDNAFYNCTSLISVNIGDGVTSVGISAFYGCSSLEYVNIGKNVTTISRHAFNSCTLLKNVSILNYETYIEGFAFDISNLIQDIYYGGTEENWMWKVALSEYGYGFLADANIHYKAIGSAPPRIVKIPTVNVNGNEYTFNIQLEDVEYESCLVTALYEKNTLTGIKATDISYDNIPESINVTAGKADSAKVFIWDMLNGMKPLCDVVDVEIITE